MTSRRETLTNVADTTRMPWRANSVGTCAGSEFRTTARWSVDLTGLDAAKDDPGYCVSADVGVGLQALNLPRPADLRGATSYLNNKNDTLFGSALIH